MAGDAYINGSVAYVAGEQVSLTYNGGLFDIQVPVGTSVERAIVHTGTTGGPSSTGSGDNHLIYAVARAAADPVSMLLRGNLGFDAAASASIDNGDIILSAGYDVFGRNVFTGPVDEAAAEESITVQGGTQFGSSVLAAATGRFTASTAIGQIGFADDLTVRAARAITLSARSGNDLSIGGDVRLEARGTIAASGDVTGGTIDLVARDGSTLSVAGALSAFATPIQDGGAATGGDIDLVARGGTIDIGGDVSLEAQANTHRPSGPLGDSFGGFTRIYATDGGTVSLGGSLSMVTYAFGNGLAGREARGGQTELVADAGGSIGIAGNVNLLADAFGGDADGSQGIVDGGAAYGGLTQVLARGGTVDIGGSLLLSATGNGGSGAGSYGNSTSDTGGLGEGGQALVNAVDGSITVAAGTALYAMGYAGSGTRGGVGRGGLAQMFANGTGRISTQSATFYAQGVGGYGFGDSSVGGDGYGGQAVIYTQGNGDILVDGTANLTANGAGGGGNSGGDGVGGNAGLYAVHGTIAVSGQAYLYAQGLGGNAAEGFGGTGGDGTGGTAFIQADGSLDQSASLSVGLSAYIYAQGSGGYGGSGNGSDITAGNGGNGTGGTFQGAPGTGGAFALAGRDNATLAVGGTTYLSAAGFGGRGGQGGTGQAGGNGGIGLGGTAQAGTFSGRGDGSLGGGRALFEGLTLQAGGFGGSGGYGEADYGNGGVGIGGFAGVFANRSLVEASDITTSATGSGGFGATGGDGFGGNVGIGVVSGTLNAANLYAYANASGGSGFSGDGGTATGGEASVDTDGALNVSGNIDYFAYANGGFSEAGRGGDATAGIARFTAEGEAQTGVGGSIFLSSWANAGDGVVGGNGTGGRTLLTVEDAASVEVGSVYLQAYARGGDGREIAGDGIGGDARLIVRGGQFTALGSIIAGAYGYGGNGLEGADGGTGYGGIAGMVVRSGEASIGSSLAAYASGIGGSATGIGGDGGDGYGGLVLLTIDGDSGRMGSLFVGESIDLFAFGDGGDGGSGDGPDSAGSQGGDGFGGTRDIASMVDPSFGTGTYLSVDANYGSLVAPGSTFMSAGGIGGSGGSGLNGAAAGMGGRGVGGYVVAQFVGSGIDGPRAGYAELGRLSLDSYGFGGQGGTDENAEFIAAGGEGRGGETIVDINGGQLVADTVYLSSYGFGGTGSTGGNGRGGRAGMSTGNGGLITVGEFSSYAYGYGGQGTTGRGGDGVGGFAFLGFEDGVTTITQRAIVDASGYGGYSQSGDGGDGFGGDAEISLSRGFGGQGSVGGATSVLANGFGGVSGSTDALGGNGFGGEASVLIPDGGGAIDLISLYISASGLTGFGPDGTGSGSGTGGLVKIQAETGSDLSIGYLEIRADGAETAGSFAILADGGTIAIDQAFLSAQGVVAGDTSRIRARGGAIPISDYADIRVTGDLRIITSGGGAIGGPTVDNPTAGISIDAGGTVTIDGDDDDRIGFGGRELYIQSRDLDILSGARIGAQFLRLGVIGNDHWTVIGGNTQTEGYTLTQQELGRIEADVASFSSSFDGAQSDNILFRNTIIFGSLGDGVAALEVEAGGIVRVEGMVSFLDAADDDYFGIFAERLEIVTPGGIQMVAPDGSFTGVFQFEGGEFWMADADTIALLREDPAFDGRNDILASVAAGSADPLGYLRAGDVEIDVETSLLVRNTGTDAAPGGITVSRTLTIDGDGPELPIDLFAYGRKQNADGTFVVGEEFFQTVDFNGDGSEEEAAQTYSDGSQFNNCELATGECAEIETPPPPPEPEEPEEPEEPDEVEEREEVLEIVEEAAASNAAIVADPVAATPVEQTEQDSNVEFGSDFPGLLTASTEEEDSSVDDPVASGGDTAQYGSASGETGEENNDDR